MVSIKGLRQQKQKREQIPNLVQSTEKKPQQIFSEQKFHEVWNAYIVQLKNAGKPSLANTLEVAAPKIVDNDILIEVENTVQENELNGIKSALMNFLRKELDNYTIQLKYNKVKVKKTVTYYTNKERFNRLVELNPTLLNLKNRLNLDTDY